LAKSNKKTWPDVACGRGVIMFERRTIAERIELAKTKMEKVLDHFLYVVELHANNSLVVYSPTLASHIRRL
jgi:hypothetical protein